MLPHASSPCFNFWRVNFYVIKFLKIALPKYDISDPLIAPSNKLVDLHKPLIFSEMFLWNFSKLFHVTNGLSQTYLICGLLETISNWSMSWQLFLNRRRAVVVAQTQGHLMVGKSCIRDTVHWILLFEILIKSCPLANVALTSNV